MRGRAAYFRRRRVRICLRSFICYTGLFRIRFVTTEERRPKNGPKDTSTSSGAADGISAAPHFTNGQARGRGKEWPLADDKRRPRFLFPPLPILIIRVQKMEMPTFAFRRWNACVRCTLGSRMVWLGRGLCVIDRRGDRISAVERSDDQTHDTNCRRVRRDGAGSIFSQLPSTFR